MQTAGRELRGVVCSVEDGQADRKYLPNVLVTVVDFGVSGTTNDQGFFRVRLPAGVLPGQDVTLQEDQKDYYILFPVLSKLRVPATPAQLVELWMAPRGSKVLLGANFIEQFIKYTADDSAKKPRDPKSGAPDLSSYVNELARQSGRPAEEILGQISQWAAEAKESDDPRKLGLAAFAEKKFLLAAENFGKAADAEKRRGAEGFRKSAADHSLEGDSYSSALEFSKALQAYQAAQGDLGVYRKGRDDLGLPPYPEYASDVRNLTAKIANVKVDLGIRVAGTDSQRYLEEAIQENKGLILQISKTSDPQFWAQTQNNLGGALWSLGEREGGAEGARRLTEAVETFRQALTVRTRDVLPQQWADTQNILGIALQLQIGLYGFAKGLEQVDCLWQAEGIRDDPVAQASLRTLALVCQVATGHGDEAQRTFGSLVALVERQPADFRLVWDWAPLRKLVAESKAPSVSAHRVGLQKLIDAVDRDNKAAILAGLQEVQDALTPRGDEPVKQLKQ